MPVSFANSQAGFNFYSQLNPANRSLWINPLSSLHICACLTERTDRLHLWRMNPPEWEEAKRRLQRHQDLNHHSVPKSIIKNESETGDDWHRYRPYSRNTVDEPQNIQLGVGVGCQGPGSDPDGFPSDVDRCSGASLKDRVNRILQQRHPAGFLSQVRNQLTDDHRFFFTFFFTAYSIALSCLRVSLGKTEETLPAWATMVCCGNTIPWSSEWKSL